MSSGKSGGKAQWHRATAPAASRASGNCVRQFVAVCLQCIDPQHQAARGHQQVHRSTSSSIKRLKAAASNPCRQWQRSPFARLVRPAAMRQGHSRCHQNSSAKFRILIRQRDEMPNAHLRAAQPNRTDRLPCQIPHRAPVFRPRIAPFGKKAFGNGVGGRDALLHQADLSPRPMPMGSLYLLQTSRGRLHFMRRHRPSWILLARRIIGRFARDRNVVDMALAQTCVGDADKLRALLQVGNRARARV